MAKKTLYYVTVTRECTESTIVDVRAASRGEAWKRALAKAHDRPGLFEWVHDECSGDPSTPYLAGYDDDIEEVTS